MYVIRNEDNARYLKYDLRNGLNIRWVPEPQHASRFVTVGKARNFLVNNYRGYQKRIPTASSVKVEELEQCRSDAPQREQPVLPAGRSGQEEASGAQVIEIRTRSEAEACLAGLPSLVLLEQQILAMKRYYSNVLSLADQERNDLLLKIELDDRMNAADRAVLFKHLRETLRWRRTCKNMLELIHTCETSGFLDACRRLEEGMESVKQEIRNRRYAPRVLTDLFESSPDLRKEKGGIA